MDCIYRDMIDDYVEGKLGREEKLSFEDHLQSCPECMNPVCLQRLANRIISEEKNTAPDIYMAGRIMARIENIEKEAGSALIRIMRPVAIMFSVAAAIFAGVLIGNISAKSEVKAAPVELTLMNDNAMESVNVLSEE